MSPLDGYSFAEWPNLSGDRSPAKNTYTTSQPVSHSEDGISKNETTNTSVILLAIARVIGVYCGISDVLIAVKMGHHGNISLVRIMWNEDDTWAAAKVKVDHAVHNGLNEPLSLSNARRHLSLDDNQCPYVVLCTFDQSFRTPDVQDTPIFSYTSQDSIIHLSASNATMHPTVATQVLLQVVGFIRQGSESPLLSLASTPSFTSDLMSIFERGSVEDVTLSYSHISAVSFAPDFLAQRAIDMPLAIAVCWYPELSLDSSEFAYENMSYIEFHRKSNQVARWLLRLGLQPEDRIAVCLDRNLHFHTSMMGIMRAGGCYVPIDPELPLERKLYIAKDANATFVLTSSEIASPDVFGTRTIYIEDDVSQSQILQESDEDLNCMKSDGLAYLLYTSGTTGNPKGCLLTHHGLAQAILALSSTAADVRMKNIHNGRYLAVASIAFDVHLGETIVPLALGMPLLSARRTQLLENLPCYVKKLGITHLGIVPSLIEATLNASQSGTDGSETVLRYIASGGEKMSDSILDKWADHPYVRLANFYGPSEVTIGCCARYMTSRTPKANIGRPFANVSGYVVDPNMNILLRGGVGELVVEGPLVGRGYHGRPDITGKVFLEWPRKGCWAYRTGDLVRMMPDSTIEILGRIDTQIKLRGVRIESEGISAIVRKAILPTDTIALDATTVLAKHPAINVDQLVSFFTWDNTVTISTRKSQKPSLCDPPPDFIKKIKAKCEIELPSYMRPSHFIPLNWLPLSSNGKTDAKVLIELFKKLGVEEIARLSAIQEVQEARSCTDMEIKVFEVLQNHVAMKFDNPHPGINIFESGLDSMGVIRFTSELMDVFKVKVAAANVMKAPSIRDIASYITTAVDADRPRRDIIFNIPAIDEIYSTYIAESIENVLPPFTIQEGVLSRSADQNTLYVQHVIISCKPAVSIPLLQRAWKTVVDRNQILRTIFHFGRTLSQVVLNPQSCSLNWSQKELFMLAQNTSFSQYFMAQEASLIAKQVNETISTVSPYRLSAYQANDRIYLVLSIHHALFDGISLPMLFEQVERSYLGLELSPTATISDLLQQITAVDYDMARAFWKNYFTDYVWPLSMLYPKGVYTTQQLTLPLKSPLSLIKKLAASQRVTMQALFTCAFGHLLARKVYKQKDVVFGVLRSGRLLPVDYIEKTVCPLVSILPVRVDFGGKHMLLQAIQDDISSTIEYEHIPLGKIQGWIRPNVALFEALFSVSVNESPQSELWDVIESEPPEADYPLAVEIVIEPSTDSVTLKARWMDEGLPDSPNTWLCDFENVVKSLADNPSPYLFHSLQHLPRSSQNPRNEQENECPTIDHSCLDAALIRGLRTIISDFMGFNPLILTPTISLISMGLDSIKSVGLAKFLTKHGFPMTSTDILRNATLNELASCIENKRVLKDDLPAITMPDISQTVLSEANFNDIKLSKEDVEFFPTTALQAGMLSQTVNSNGQLYIHSFPLRITGPVDAKKMRNAWEKAVETFAILRTSFHFSTESGVWIQAVHSSSLLDWETISVASTQDYQRELKSFLSSIDLGDETCFTRPPFWVRFFEIKSSASQPLSFLVLVLHHSLYDGISIGKLVQAVEHLYSNISIPPVVQFHELLPQFLHHEQEGTSFWVDRVRLYKPKPLRQLHPSSSANTSATVEKIIELDSSRVTEVLRQACVTIQCLCQAAWAKVLSKYTKSSDIVFGHTISGRSIPGAEDVIGPVLNTIPCCIRIEGKARNIELLKSIHQSNLDALQWQQASARAIQKVLGVENLWDSLFLFQQAASYSGSNSKISWAFDEEIIVDEAKYPLNVEIIRRDSDIIIRCASHPSFINQTNINLLVDDFRTFLLDILNNLHASALEGIILTEDASSNQIKSKDGFDKQNFDQDCGPDSMPSSTPPIAFAYKPILMGITNAPSSLIQPETPLSTLGVDSIMAIQIVGKFRQNGMKIVASDVIASKTIGEMLAKASPLKPTSVDAKTFVNMAISDKERAVILSQIGDLSQNIENITVVSSGMKWLIGAWQKSLRTRYQHVFPFQLPKNLDIAKMRESWSSLLQRHPILRSTFTFAKGYQEPRLVTFKSFGGSWSEEYVPDEVFFRSIISRMKDMVSNPPSLALPPSRALLFHSTQHYYLILHLHHFQYDAWSLQLLLHDLSRLYRDLEPTTSSNLQGFLEFYSIKADQSKEQRKYWRSHFPSQFQPTLFPALNPKARQCYSKERLIRTNQECITNVKKCEERARILGLSLQSVFLACWASMQASISSSSSSTFGVWHSGRTGTLDDIANLAVPCMNVLPLHVPHVDQSSVLQIARWISSHLPTRTSVIEQSDLVHLNELVGLKNKPICNVFVNIVKVAPDTDAQDPIIEPVYAPYFVPETVTMEDDIYGIEWDITKLMNDDIMVDISTLTRMDSVMMSIDAAPHMMDATQADALMRRWANSVEGCLGIL
ncbi:NRPS [Psilocybe cubensis]|uniref:Carrier domain-containing protein n=2 Tax=Psilocybe cubensis TaxID=181762 RepID=A0A8H7Y2T1_PSICU|nr:NRPS [Psilocybe cubensis]KAH9484356.1 NRPS [Psilocybe cubensis]